MGMSEYEKLHQRISQLVERNEQLGAELECALGDLATAKGVIDRLQKDADRYQLIKSKACTEDRDGGYTGFWRLPCMPAWDCTMRSRSEKSNYSYRDSLDKSVDSVIAKERT
jgi:hypothetical protein